ncbi:MAG: RNA polymerase factor sigma-54 [Acidobacteria bacterium]|nr:RNA polymerase factor sigma-54 [Acidobacteriota bacterium]
MALEQKLRLKLSQRLVMTPSLQQAIKLLQLSRLELEETLSQEIMENPMLEVEEEEAPHLELADAEKGPLEEETPPVVPDDPLPSPEESYGDIDVEAFFADYLGNGHSEGPSMAVSDESISALENIAATSPDLHEHLMWQLHLVDAPPELIEAGEYIVGNLDDDGYLRVSDEEISQASRLGTTVVARAKELVRSLDPPGVGASSLQECLILQLCILMQDADEEEREVFQRALLVLEEHWDTFLHQRWQEVAQALGCGVEELGPVVQVIERLDPKPGRRFLRDDNSYIEPDVFVKKVGDEYVVSLNDDGLPRLRMSSRYLRMLEGKGLDRKAQTFLREKMRNALWLMKSIDQRQRTIYKVAQSIVNYQKDFLDHGMEHLKPMVLRQVAEDIGMHESTISRVVSNKYMHTPRGTFPMKYFFHAGVDSARGGNVSSLVVKERIRKLIEAEDPQKPLSDSRIMKLLQHEGIRLARRTVAKYREELNIPSSEKRKRVF